MEVEKIKVAILEILEHQPGGMLSAAVGMELQKKLGQPIRSLGIGKLTDFIREHLGEFVNIHYEGLVVTYMLKADPSVSAAGEGAPVLSPAITPTVEATDLLRVWRSPGARSRLVVRVADGTVRYVGPDEVVVLAEGEAVLESVSPEFLATIARDFAQANMPPEVKDAFLAAIDPANPTWWQQWEKLFKEHPSAPRQTWLTSRHHQLRQELLTKLRALGLSEEAAEFARQTIEAKPTKLKSVAPLPQRSVGTAPAVGQTPSQLRQALLSVLSQLSEHELRDVWVPAGLLYDALRR